MEEMCTAHVLTQGCARIQGQKQGFTSRRKILSASPCLIVRQGLLPGAYTFTRYNKIVNKFANVNKKNHTGLVS